MSDKSLEENVAMLRMQMMKAKNGEVDFTTERLCQCIESDLKWLINSAWLNLQDHMDLISKLKESKQS